MAREGDVRRYEVELDQDNFVPSRGRRGKLRITVEVPKEEGPKYTCKKTSPPPPGLKWTIGSNLCGFPVYPEKILERARRADKDVLISEIDFSNRQFQQSLITSHLYTRPELDEIETNCRRNQAKVVEELLDNIKHYSFEEFVLFVKAVVKSGQHRGARLLIRRAICFFTASIRPGRRLSCRQKFLLEDEIANAMRNMTCRSELKRKGILIDFEFDVKGDDCIICKLIFPSEKALMNFNTKWYETGELNRFLKGLAEDRFGRNTGVEITTKIRFRYDMPEYDFRPRNMTGDVRPVRAVPDGTFRVTVSVAKAEILIKYGENQQMALASFLEMENLREILQNKICLDEQNCTINLFDRTFRYEWQIGSFGSVDIYIHCDNSAVDFLWEYHKDGRLEKELENMLITEMDLDQCSLVSAYLAVSTNIEEYFRSKGSIY